MSAATEYPEITRHDENGAITREWALGHADPEHAETVVVDRVRLYPAVARPGPAWRWMYVYRADNGPEREYGTDLTACRRMLERAFPNATIRETWR